MHFYHLSKSIFSLVITFFYSFVKILDRLLGNGATNVVYPITVIALALSLIIGDGCAAYLSLCQGKGEIQKSHQSVGNAILLAILVGILLMLFFTVFQEKILWGFGATKNNIEYAHEYFRYIVFGIPFYVFGNALNGVIRADGSPKFAMFSTLVGCIINIILDPIAIFILKWGMMGAAVATVAGQIVTALLAVYYLFHSKSFSLNYYSFCIDFNILKKIIPLGGTSFLTQISIVVIMAVMNNTLVQYGAQSKYGADIPLTVVGIVMKVFSIAISIVIGITVGSQPIVGYNYGAGKINRVKELFYKIIMAEVVVGLLATICFECFPIQIITIFGNGNALYQEFASLSFRIYLSTVLLCGIHKAICIFLQSLGKSLFSTFLSLLREFILSVPLILILSKHFGVIGALFSAPIADIISFTMAVIIEKYVMEQICSKQQKTTFIKKSNKAKIVF